jgi:hypothetical protein
VRLASYARAREARGSCTSPLPFSPAMLGRAGAWTGTAGPCCGEPGLRATRVPRWSAAEDGREAAARRRRLKSVEKFLTRNRPTRHPL